MKKRVACFFTAILLIFSNQTSALAWNALTHYRINQQNSNPYPMEDTFCANGTGPDMFINVPLVNPVPELGEEGVAWADIVHCPNPKGLPNGTRPFEEKPNFSYLMYTVSNGNTSSLAEAYSLGWGGHISADWVAHNDRLFKIVDELPGLALHANAEVLCDYYVFLTKGPIPLSFRFNPDLVCNALANYQMIKVHETQAGSLYSDEELKSKVLEETLPRSTIKSCCRRWAGIVAAMQVAYTIKAARDNIEIPEFINKMEAKGVEENILLSENSVRNWLIARTPRGTIPDYSAQVIPFYPFPIAAVPNGQGSIFSGPFAWMPDWMKYPFTAFAPQPAWANESSQDQEPEQAADPDKITYAFWNKVADEAEAAGILQYTEEIAQEEGEEQYIITPQIQSQTEFENILISTIQDSINNPSSDADRKYAVFYHNLLEESISDPDILLDTTSPSIVALSPANSSITPYHKPTISFRAIDEPGGIGIDHESVRIALDDQPPIKPNYMPELDLFLCQPSDYLSTGEHTMTVELSDKAGNVTEITSVFTIKSVFNHALFSNETTVLEGHPAVFGDVYSKDKPILCGSPKIFGNIYTLALILRKGNPFIEGSICEECQPIDFPQVDFDYYKHMAKTQGTFIEGDKKFKPGKEPLPGGLVFINGDVTLDGNCSNNDSSSISVTIVCSGQIKVAGKLALSPAQDNLLLLAKDSIRIAGDNNLAGAIYSENGAIKITDKNNFQGTLSAKSGIYVSDNSVIKYNPGFGE